MKKVFKHLGIQLLDQKKEGKTTTLIVINNPDGTPRWICNATSKSPLFFKFYLIKTFRSQLVSFAIKMIFSLGLQRLIFKTKKINYKDLDNKIKSIIDISDTNWAIFTGTVGPNNKLLIYENGKDENSFYKIAYSQKAQSLIKKEEEVINEFKEIQPITFVFPLVERIQQNVIKLEDISLFGKRTTKFGNLHQLVLSELYSKTAKSVEGYALPIFNLSLLRLYKLEECGDTRIPKGILKKLRVMLEAMRSKSIEVGLCHGDFTPWNMYVRNEKLAIYDWELATFLMPIGYDAFHYIIQQGILVDKKSWKVIKAKIKSKITFKVFRQWSKQEHNDIDQYLKYYLTINIISNLELYAKQGKWHEQVYWLLNTWNEAISDSVKEIQPQRELMIMDIFDFLNNKDYAAIKFPNISPGKLSEFSDIDLCIKKDDLKGILMYLKNHPLTAHLCVNKKSFMATIQVFIKDDGFLSLDLIWKFKRKSFVMLNAENVIQNSYQNSFHVKQMGLLEKIRYIGLFYGLNNLKIPSEYKAYQQILNKEESRLDDILYCNYLDDTTRKRDLIHCLKKEKDNKYLNRVINILGYYWDSFTQLFSSKGMVITFSGIDGSGKSTVIENIKQKIEKKTRKRVIVLRHRPSILPILSVWTKGRKKAKKDVLNALPRQGNNNSYIGSLFRFFYYYIDYLFGQFYIYFKYVRRGYIVLYDRYYFDFISDSKRSNILLPKSIIKTGYRFLIKPDLNFFLYTDAKTILKRKQELDLSTIKTLTNEYLQLFKELDTSSSKQYFTIENNELNKTLGFVLNKTTQKLAYIS